MAYLEQSTRYVPYTDRPNGRWKYHVPAEARRLAAARRVRRARSTAPSRPTRAGSRRWRRTSARSTRRSPTTPTASTDRSSAPRRSTRCAACCRRRRTSNVGLFGTGQAFEALLLRMFAHPLARSPRLRASRCSTELRQVIPAFLDARRSAEPRRTLDRVPRRHAARLRDGRRSRSSARSTPEPRDEVTLTDFDPEGEIKVVAAALYAASGAARRSAAGDRARAVGRRSRRAAPRLRRQRAQPPPQAGTRVRAHQLPLRRPRRLRRVPRSAAPSAADARVAAAQHAPWLHRAGGDRGGRRARRLARRSWTSPPISTSSCWRTASATPRRTPS